MTARANALIVRASVPSGVIRAWVDAFERLGYCRDALLAAAHIRAADLADPDSCLPCEAYGAIIGSALRLRPAKNLGMQLARVTPLGAYPLLDYLVLTSDTVGAGITQLARYFRLVGSPTTFQLLEEADRTTTVLDSGGIHFGVEYTIALMVFHMRGETAGAFAADRIDFAAIPDDPEELERVFGCPVRSGAASNCVVVSRSTWELPLARRDAALRSVLEKHPAAAAADAARHDGLSNDVRRALSARVNGGELRIESVARELAMAPRTLQRKLGEERVTYHALVEEARRAAAERHLGDRRLSVSEIAYLLGYSEPAAFHRAFKRWHGVSPQAYRGRRSEGDSPPRTPRV